MEADVAASRDAGFAEHLTKPVDLDRLQAAIARVAGEVDTSGLREYARTPGERE